MGRLTLEEVIEPAYVIECGNCGHKEISLQADLDDAVKEFEMSGWASIETQIEIAVVCKNCVD